MNSNQLLEQLKMITVWLTIKGYPNYEVSICGMARNVITKRILKPAITGNGYYGVVLCNGKRKTHKIHRLVANAFIPRVDTTKTYVDHIDNNRINNTISNLRWCNFQENHFNRQLSSKNTSGIKGVSWDKHRQKWIAFIKVNQKYYNLGRFANIDDAKQMRQLKAKELFGEYINACEL